MWHVDVYGDVFPPQKEPNEYLHNACWSYNTEEEARKAAEEIKKENQDVD